MLASLRSWKGWAGAALIALLLPSCESSGPLPLVIQVRTDLSVGVEFDAVLVRVRSGPSPDAETLQRLSYVPRPVDDFVVGVSVAELELPAGVTYITGALVRDTVDVLARPLVVDLREPLVSTLVFARSCLGIECPVSDGDPTAVACVGGECVSPECTPETPEACPSGVEQCTLDDDCPDSGLCATDACADGVCFSSPEPLDLPCNDGDMCTEVGSCDGLGACVSGAPIACGEFGCGACDPASGCTSGTVTESAACNPGTCTTDGSCSIRAVGVAGAEVRDIDTDGEWAAIGRTGEVELRRRGTDGLWATHSTLTPPADGIVGTFGYQVALDGDRLAVLQGGLTVFAPSQFAVRVYGYVTASDRWEPLQTVTSDDMLSTFTRLDPDWLSDLHMEDGRILGLFPTDASAPSPLGIAVLTTMDSTSWSHVETLVPSTGPVRPLSLIAGTLAANGSRVMIGDALADSGAGLAALFEWTGDGYLERAILRRGVANTGVFNSIDGDRVYIVSASAGTFEIEISEWTMVGGTWEVNDLITPDFEAPPIASFHVRTPWMVVGQTMRSIDGVPSGAVLVMEQTDGEWTSRALAAPAGPTSNMGTDPRLEGDALFTSRATATAGEVYVFDLAELR